MTWAPVPRQGSPPRPASPMVNVNRTLRRLREERLALVDRGVVIVTDLAGLRGAAAGSAEPVDETGGGIVGNSGVRPLPLL